MPATSSALESAQRHDDGSARFLIPVQTDAAAWNAVATAEQDGGYLPELRIFLDAQLGDADVVIDTATGLGIIALSAATVPGGAPRVFALGDAQEQSAIDLAAIDAGRSIEWFTATELLSGALASRILKSSDTDLRVFMHATVRSLLDLVRGAASLIEQGKVVAICLSTDDGETDAERVRAHELLGECGFVAHELRDHHGEPTLVGVSSLSADIPVIALVSGEAVHDGPASDVPATDREPAAPAPAAAPSKNAAVGTVFSFIAPYCRTGYGVVGAHLLREFTRLNTQVAYFPLGGIDQSVVGNAQLGATLQRQGLFDERAPSVRLSQQFDLALHVGRGPRIGFPIFELDRFRENERHHLMRQDRLLVTCEWARRVLLDDGITGVPIDIVPLGVDREIFHEQLVPAALPGGRSAGETVFVTVGKLEPRKGQLELLRAFEAAFSPKDAVRLVLVCHNPFVSERQFDEMAAPFRRSPLAKRITLVTKPFPTQRELAPAMMAADCAVFPVRAEGWNLEALEMLALGKPVIATDYSAHTAFLTPQNARLVPVTALEQPQGASVGRWAAWGAEQHDALVAHLRAVHSEKQSGALARNDAGIATSHQFSWTAAALALLDAVRRA